MEWLWNLDQSGFRFFHLALRNPVLDPLMWVLSTTGLGYVQVLAVLLGPLAFSRRFRQPRPPGLREAARVLSAATWQSWRDSIHVVGPLLTVIAVSGVVFSGGSKLLVERDRPSNLALAQPAEGFYANSFPSGHSTTSFAIAAMLLLICWGTPYRKWGYGALVWAVLVGISRIYRGIHWPSDVLAGAFAGMVAAALCHLTLRKLGRAAQA